MRILVVSDSHSMNQDMVRWVEKICPDEILHLGDYYDDRVELARRFPQIPMLQVPGNCDCYRSGGEKPEVLVRELGGVRFFMTHGHRHHVKTTLALLVSDAAAAGASVALYGHTHVPDCHYEEGILVFNPGSCGFFQGNAGVIEVESGRILSANLYGRKELESNDSGH